MFVNLPLVLIRKTFVNLFLKIKDDILDYLLYKSSSAWLFILQINWHSTDCFNDWTLNIENKQYLNVIYIDFAKAIDSIVHRILILKLMSYGVVGCLLSWISNFLTDRFQYVCIDGFYSSTVRVIRGVTQGSVLGSIFIHCFRKRRVRHYCRERTLHWLMTLNCFY